MLMLFALYVVTSILDIFRGRSIPHSLHENMSCLEQLTCLDTPQESMSTRQLTSLSAGGHQALAAFVVVAFTIAALASIHCHTNRNKCKNMTLRTVSLLREAARCHQRSVRGSTDPGDTYADAARARIYIAAVDRVLTSEDLARVAGIQIDEFRQVVDAQLSAARSKLGSTVVRPAHHEQQQQQQLYHQQGAAPALPAFRRRAMYRN